MRTQNKGYRMLGMLLVVCCVMGVVGIAAAKEALLIGMADDTVSLDPAKSYEISAWAVMTQMYEKLVDYENGNYTTPVPALAESWDISADGKTWMFHLNKQAIFASGNPVTADAVVFSLRRLIKFNGTPAWILNQFNLTENAITKIDDRTVQIGLDKPYAPGLFLACLASNIGYILDEKLVQSNEKDGDMGNAWLETHSAGSGRFILTERTPGKQYVLTANMKYWQTPSKFQQLIIKVIPESIDQLAQLEQGDIDLAYDVRPENIQTLLDNPEIRVIDTLTLNMFFLAMNLGFEPLQKPLVREAIRTAIDYDGLITAVMGGAGERLQTFIPKGLLGYNTTAPYQQDVAKAKQLLTEAGYPEGFDVELKYFNLPPNVEIAIKIKADLEKIGIRVTLNPRTSEQAMAEFYTDLRATQLFITPWTIDYPDPDANAKPFAFCNNIGEDASVKNLAWDVRYMNQETTPLTEQAALERDPIKRAALYKEITEKILHDGPYAILFMQMRQIGVRTEVADAITFPPIIWFLPTIK